MLNLCKIGVIITVLEALLYEWKSMNAIEMKTELSAFLLTPSNTNIISFLTIQGRIQDFP